MTGFDNCAAIELFDQSLPRRSFICDVGAGSGEATRYLQGRGHVVADVDYGRQGTRFEDLDVKNYFDGIYCSHMLEHVRNVGILLDKFRETVVPGGYLCVIVPPAKHNVVGGHLTIWNAGILLYNLVRAHFDCSDARVRSYGYNIAVLFRNYRAEFDENTLHEDNGDLEILAPFFPFPIEQGFDGRVESHNWRPFGRSDG